MAALAAQASWRDLAMAAHSLLGIGRMLGLDDLTANLLAIEEAARAESASSVRGRMDRLPVQVSAAVGQLEDWLRHPPESPPRAPEGEEP